MSTKLTLSRPPHRNYIYLYSVIFIFILPSFVYLPIIVNPHQYCVIIIIISLRPGKGIINLPGDNTDIVSGTSLSCISHHLGLIFKLWPVRENFARASWVSSESAVSACLMPGCIVTLVSLQIFSIVSLSFSIGELECQSVFNFLSLCPSASFYSFTFVSNWFSGHSLLCVSVCVHIFPMLLYPYIFLWPIIFFSLRSSILLFRFVLVKVFLCPRQSSLLHIFFILTFLYIFLHPTTFSLPLSLSHPHTPTRTTCSSFCLPQGPVDKRQICIIVQEPPTLCFHHSPSVSCTLCLSPLLFIFLHHSPFYLVTLRLSSQCTVHLSPPLSIFLHHFLCEIFAPWFKKLHFPSTGFAIPGSENRLRLCRW